MLKKKMLKLSASMTFSNPNFSNQKQPRAAFSISDISKRFERGTSLLQWSLEARTTNQTQIIAYQHKHNQATSEELLSND